MVGNNQPHFQKMVRIQICTYNVLAEKYFQLMTKEIKEGVPCYPKMTSPQRETQLFQEISKIMRFENVIFCLQEITQDSITRFTNFFNNHDYSVESVLYNTGSKDEYQLGVLIAYPNDSFSVEQVEKVVVCDQLLGRNTNENLAKKKKNEAIFIKFTDSIEDSSFVVGTYHAPCSVDNEEVATLHANCLVKFALETFPSDHIILAGDFNVTPNRQAYHHITSLLKSAWDLIGKFPITNHAFIKGTEFSGCLDHVFFTSSVECKRVLVDSPTNIIPDSRHSSDHVPVIVELEF